MTTQLELRHYPDRAGHQGGDTDRAAAAAIEGSGQADLLRVLCQSIVSQHPAGLTPDEAAGYLGRDVLSIRPRFTELKSRGLFLDTGLRRPSSRGHPQRVLKGVL